LSARLARAFAPGHITGLFRIHDSSKEPLYSGSTGAGFSVLAGTTTTVSLLESKSLDMVVEYNKKRIDAPVTTTVVRTLAEQYDQTFSAHIEHESSIPIGVGFGASGAGALSTALALGRLLDPKMTRSRAAGFAHCAEVVNHTGLGDVIGQFKGGVEVRTHPGAPGIGRIVSIPYDKELRVVLAGGEGLNAKRAALTDAAWHDRINQAADKLVESVETHRSLSMLVACSRRFAEAAGFATARVTSGLDMLDSAGLGLSAQVMLGDSIFCFCTEETTGTAVSILSNLWEPHEVMVTSVAAKGGQVIG